MTNSKGSPWAKLSPSYLGEISREVVFLVLGDLAQDVVEEDGRI
jgi:hypothetical protein